MGTDNRQQGLLALDVRFMVALTTEEFRIVSRALSAAGGQRPFGDEGQAEALVLQQRLFDARQKQVAAWASSIAKTDPVAPVSAPQAGPPAGPRPSSDSVDPEGEAIARLETQGWGRCPSGLHSAKAGCACPRKKKGGA